MSARKSPSRWPRSNRRRNLCARLRSKRSGSDRVRSRAKSFAATNAEALAEHHFGDAIYTNMIMLGMAWQHGLIPITDTASRSATSTWAQPP